MHRRSPRYGAHCAYFKCVHGTLDSREAYLSFECRDREAFCVCRIQRQ